MDQNYREIKATAKIFPDFAGRPTLLIDILASKHRSVDYAEPLWETPQTIDTLAIYFSKGPLCARM